MTTDCDPAGRISGRSDDHAAPVECFDDLARHLSGDPPPEQLYTAGVHPSIDLLPHQPPMRLVEEVIDLVPANARISAA